MTMDALLPEMRRFRDSLMAFVEVLRASEQERADAEDRLEGVWDDEFARTFRNRHAELAAPVADFAGRGADRHLGFMDDKIASLEEYFRA